jgi:tripartite-type tricarboxylate transporter receptor subunit TctC
MRPTPTITALLALALPCALWAGGAGAQSWPSKPVRVVVPFAPGGTADTLGRLVAHSLGETFKENFPFDPLRDFTHIALFGGPPGVLVVNPSLPATDLKQFIAYARAEKGKLAYGSPGNGTQGHLIAEQLKQVTGIEMTHVPYKGASLAVSDLIAGHVMVTSTTLTTAASQIKSGRARALAVTSLKRVPDFPEIPTFAELGFPELTASIWFSLSGPAGMPPEIVNRLNAEVRRVLQLPDVRERLRPEGIEPGDLDPQQFTAFVAAELKRWAPVVRASGARAD